MKYEVGKLFPDSRYIHGDMPRAIFNETFLDVAIPMDNITRSEIEAFKSKSFVAGLYKSGDIPFIVFKFQDFSIDVDLNITLLTAEQQEKWLNQNANVMNIFLIESTNGILCGIRFVSVNFSEELKDILEEQTDKTDSDINSQVVMIRNRVSTEDMLARAIKRQVF